MELQFSQLTGVELAARKAISPQQDTAGQLKPIWADLDGAVITQDKVAALVADGRVFHAYVGNASTPVTLDAAWANTDPDLSLDAPAGITVIPLRVVVVLEAFGTEALFETMTLCSKTLAAASAGTKFTPINLRTRHTRESACSVYVGPTVTSGYTTGAFELFRECIQKAVTVGTGDDDSTAYPTKFEWNYLKDGPAPMLEGQASMATWATSQAASGYIQYVWAEVPTLPSP